MRRTRNFILLVVFIFFTNISCQEDDTDDILPVVDDRDKFIGQWNVNDENCQRSRYIVEISPDPSNSIQVLITNFGFSKATIPDTAIVAGTTITLPLQTNSEKWIISGIGKFGDGEISWNYSLEISGDLLDCTATYIQ